MHHCAALTPSQTLDFKPEVCQYVLKTWLAIERCEELLEESVLCCRLSAGGAIVVHVVPAQSHAVGGAEVAVASLLKNGQRLRLRISHQVVGAGLPPDGSIDRQLMHLCSFAATKPALVLQAVDLPSLTLPSL